LAKHFEDKKSHVVGKSRYVLTGACSLSSSHKDVSLWHETLNLVWKGSCIQTLLTGRGDGGFSSDMHWSRRGSC